MKMESLEDLFVHELKDLYNAETQLVKALPKMAKAASSDQLRSSFEEHAKVTERQIERLDRIFNEMGKNPKGKKCQAMEGLIEEGKEVMKERMDPSVKDAALIAAAQRVEHYEIAGYGTVRTFAGMLGRKDVQNLLQETLDEESEADRRLTELAETTINPMAAEMEMAEE